MNRLALVFALAVAAHAFAADADKPKRVYVGVYLNDVSDFDLKAGRFKADLRVWVKWSGGETVPPIEFENGELDTKDEIARESDGAWHSVQWRVQGTFRGDFPVHAFPFDQQVLPVRFSLPASEGELVPDLGASSMSPGFSITGWLFSPFFAARATSRHFGSDLGSIRHEGDNASVQSVSFVVEMSRPIQPYLLKFLLPLAMILAMAVLALFLPVSSLSERSAMGITALLSCIAFHFTQSDTLPNVSYLVAADKLFLAAYVLIALSLVFTVLGYNLRERAKTLTLWFDRVGYVAIPLSAVISVSMLMTRPSPPPAAVVVPKPPMVTKRTELRLGTSNLTRRAGTVTSFTVRGLTIKSASGVDVAVLAEEAPTMTNGLVRLLADGGMVVRWRLKPGLKWSDGRPITAEDLEFNLSVRDDPDQRAISRVDSRTVDVEYSNREAERLTWTSLYPAHLARGAVADGGVEKMNELQYAAGAVVAGPYTVSAFEPGKQLVMTRNPHFSGTSPVIERVSVVQFESPAALAEALATGAIDLVSGPAATVLTKLRAVPELVELRQPGESLAYLHLDVTAFPMSDLRFRKALLLAIDRDGLMKALAPAPLRIANNLRVTDAPVLTAAHDPDAASAVFKELGVPKIKLMAAKNNGIVVALKAQLEAAGLEIEQSEVTDVSLLTLKRSHGGLLVASRDSSVLARFFNIPYENNHYELETPVPGIYEQEQLALYQRSRATFYDERRLQLERRVEELWAARLPIIPLYFNDRSAFITRALEGPVYGDSDSLYWNVEQWRFTR